MQRLNGVQPSSQSQDFGFSPTVNANIQSSFHGSSQEFQRGLDPNVLASQYPEDTSKMVQAYLQYGDEIKHAPDPLYRATQLGNASQVQSMLTFMPNKPKDGS